MRHTPPTPASTFTAFLGAQRLASGTLQQVALAVRRAHQRDAQAMPLVFADATGRQLDLDTRGSEAEVAGRYAEPAAPVSVAQGETLARGPGRPRLGVVAREVTLLPEHWDWLATQPGGASVALRKLVHEARRAAAPRECARHAQERAYHFMSAIAGDLPGFEEAGRALFASDPERFARTIDAWPSDVREHLLHLADPGLDGLAKRPA